MNNLITPINIANEQNNNSNENLNELFLNSPKDEILLSTGGGVQETHGKVQVTVYQQGNSYSRSSDSINDSVSQGQRVQDPSSFLVEMEENPFDSAELKRNVSNFVIDALSTFLFF